MTEGLDLAELFKRSLPPAVQKPGLIDEAYFIIQSELARLNSLLFEGCVLTPREPSVVLASLAKPWPKAMIISRNDVKPGFWTQARSAEYLDILERDDVRKNLEQTRVIVYDKDDDVDPLRGLDEKLMLRLKRLHGRNTLFSCSSNVLKKFDELFTLRYGVTLFLDPAKGQAQFAAIPVPPSDTELVHTAEIRACLANAEKYDPESGPMRTFLTCDREYLDALHNQCNNLLRFYPARDQDGIETVV